jgi:hypothetical protein
MSALLREYEQAKKNIKPVEVQEAEAKARVQADKNYARQAAYKLYLDKFPNDPNKYQNAEKSVIGAEFTQFGTVTLGVDSEQAFKDNRKAEGYLYGGLAFLSGLGAGLVAKPVAKGVAHFSDLLKKAVVDKKPPPLPLAAKSEAFDLLNFNISPSKTDTTGVVGEADPFISPKTKNIKGDYSYPEVVTSPSMRLGLPEEKGELFTPEFGKDMGYNLNENKSLRNPNAPIIGELYSPSLAAVNNIEADSLKKVMVSPKEIDGKLYIKPEQIEQYFKPLVAKGLIKKAEYEYLIQNRLLKNPRIFKNIDVDNAKLSDAERLHRDQVREYKSIDVEDEFRMPKVLGPTGEIGVSGLYARNAPKDPKSFYQFNSMAFISDNMSVVEPKISFGGLAVLRPDDILIDAGVVPEFATNPSLNNKLLDIRTFLKVQGDYTDNFRQFENNVVDNLVETGDRVGFKNKKAFIKRDALKELVSEDYLDITMLRYRKPSPQGDSRERFDADKLFEEITVKADDVFEGINQPQLDPNLELVDLDDFTADSVSYIARASGKKLFAQSDKAMISKLLNKTDDKFFKDDFKIDDLLDAIRAIDAEDLDDEIISESIDKIAEKLKPTELFSKLRSKDYFLMPDGQVYAFGQTRRIDEDGIGPLLQFPSGDNIVKTYKNYLRDILRIKFQAKKLGIGPVYKREKIRQNSVIDLEEMKKVANELEQGEGSFAIKFDDRAGRSTYGQTQEILQERIDFEGKPTNRSFFVSINTKNLDPSLDEASREHDSIENTLGYFRATLRDGANTSKRALNVFQKDEFVKESPNLSMTQAEVNMPSAEGGDGNYSFMFMQPDETGQLNPRVAEQFRNYKGGQAGALENITDQLDEQVRKINKEFEEGKLPLLSNPAGEISAYTDFKPTQKMNLFQLRQNLKARDFENAKADIADDIFSDKDVYYKETYRFWYLEKTGRAKDINYDKEDVSVSIPLYNNPITGEPEELIEFKSIRDDQFEVPDQITVDGQLVDSEAAFKADLKKQLEDVNYRDIEYDLKREEISRRGGAVEPEQGKSTAIQREAKKLIDSPMWRSQSIDDTYKAQDKIDYVNNLMFPDNFVYSLDDNFRTFFRPYEGDPKYGAENFQTLSRDNVSIELLRDEIIPALEQYQKNLGKVEKPKAEGYLLSKTMRQLSDPPDPLNEKFLLIEEIQSDIHNRKVRKLTEAGGKSRGGKDFPLMTDDDYTENLIKSAIVFAKKKGVNKIVIPHHAKIREARHGTTETRINPDGTEYQAEVGGMAEATVQGAYKDGVRKATNKLKKIFGEDIGISKTDLLHKSMKKQTRSKKFDDVKEAYVIDITNLKFNPEEGDIFKYNEGGYVGNVDSQMSELLN